MKRGYHRFQAADGRVYQHVVVEFDSQGRMLSWHELQGEEPFVEWVGGTYVET